MTGITVEDLTVKYSGLDSSLIAALLGEYDAGKPNELAVLESQLSALHLDYQPHHSDATPYSSASEQADYPDLDMENCSEFTTPDLSETSSTSSPHPDAMLKFLETAFPNLAPEKLELKIAECSDMQTAIESILSEEYIRELAERGLEEDGSAVPPPLWIEVPARGLKKKKPPKGRTIVLSDVRKQSVVRPASAVGTSTPPPHPTPTTVVRHSMEESPWVRLDSISMRMVELLPTATPAIFLSAFHSPSHPSPAAGLRTALGAIVTKFRLPPPVPETVRFLLETFPHEDFTQDQHAEIEDVSLRDDAALCLRVAGGHIDAAIDILYILRDLARAPQFGTIHAQTSTPSTPTKAPNPPPPPRPALPPRSLTAPVLTPSLPSPSPRKPVNEWVTVGKKRKPPHQQPPHADFIPAYRVGSKGAATIQPSPTSADETAEEIAYLRREARALQSERNETLRLAMQHWKRGNSRNHGGDVAQFYAERSRDLYDAARNHSLDAARITVLQKRRRTGTQDEIDLHGLSISESQAVVLEILRDSPPNPDRPLKIITGLGKHSENNNFKSILQPALRTRLIDEGWVVRLWDAGLTVPGRRVGQT